MRAVLRALLLALLVGCLSAVRAEGISVRAADLFPGEDGYVLDVRFDVALNSTVEDALRRGLSLYFLSEFELTRPRWYWLDEKVASYSQTQRLTYNALTRQYRLSAGTLYQNFDTLDEALAVLGRIRNRTVLDRAAASNGVEYEAQVRMRLDVSLLPKPFQVNAIAVREWSLGSDWFRWKLVPNAEPPRVGGGQ